MLILIVQVSVMSAKTYAMHLRLTYFLCAQTFKPAVLIFVPVFLSILISLSTVISLVPYKHAYFAVWLALWTPANIFITISWVAPYRRHAIGLLSQCKAVLCWKKAAVEDQNVQLSSTIPNSLMQSAPVQSWTTVGGEVRRICPWRDHLKLKMINDFQTNKFTQVFHMSENVQMSFTKYVFIRVL